MHVLQIIGGQAWPNFLPILALKPRKITFLTSKDSNDIYKNQIKNIQQASKSLGHDFEITHLEIPEKFPTLEAAHNKLNQLHNNLPNQINITGGTKLMSIAAYLLASKNEIPAFYIDTRKSPSIEYLDTATHPDPIPNLQEARQKITTATALQINGFPLKEKQHQPSDNELQFGKAAAKLRNDPQREENISQSLSDLRSTFYKDNGKKFLAKGQLRSALQSPITPTPDSAWHHYLQAAAEAEIIYTEDGLHYQLTALDPQQANSKDLHSDCKRRYTTLEGFWFEHAVYQHLAEKHPDWNIINSAEADEENAASRGETDIIAFDRSSLTLHFISCKTTGPQSPLDHIQGLRQRATKEGGTHAGAHLWIFSPKSEDYKKNLQSHCQEQGVTLHILSEQSSHP